MVSTCRLVAALFFVCFFIACLFVQMEKEWQTTLYNALLSNYCLCLPEPGNLAKLRYDLCLTGFFNDVKFVYISGGLYFAT